jgi:hypothetical protein
MRLIARTIIEVLDRNIEEFAPNKTDRPFMEKLLDGVLGKQPELDLVNRKSGSGMAN